MNFRRAGLIIVVVLLVVLFFLNREDVQWLRQSDIEWKKISASGYELSSVLHLHNPNLLSSTIKSIDQKFFVNGKQVGELNNAIAQGIPGREETIFPVNIRFSKDEITELYTDHVSFPSKVEVVIKGHIVFENLFGGGKIWFDQTDSIYVSDL